MVSYVGASVFNRRLPLVLILIVMDNGLLQGKGEVYLGFNLPS